MILKQSVVVFIVLLNVSPRAVQFPSPKIH